VKQSLMMIAAVVLVGCGKKVVTNSPAVVTNSSAVVAEVQLRIRHAAGKPVGELIKADYEKVTELNLKRMGLTEFPKELEKLTTIRRLSLAGNQLTDVKGLERLMQLRLLSMRDNSDLTEDQKSKLQKALPHCSILFHL